MRKVLCVVASVSLITSLSFGEGPRVFSSGRADRPFPAISGFQLTVEPTVYDPTNLWMFIDGAAELFLTYGFMDLHVAYYRSDGGREIRSEMYRHDSPENAFGMYSQERSAEGTFIDLGVQGYAEEGSVNFLAGPYYVKTSANVNDSATARAMLGVARAVAAELAQPASWPAALSLLPEHSRVHNSEQYIAQDYLGYAFLKRAFVARYADSCRFEMFVIPAESHASVAAMAENLARANNVSLGSGKTQVIHDAHQGDIALVITDRALGGIVRCSNSAVRDSFLEILQSSMK